MAVGPTAKYLKDKSSGGTGRAKASAGNGSRSEAEETGTGMEAEEVEEEDDLASVTDGVSNLLSDVNYFKFERIQGYSTTTWGWTDPTSQRDILTTRIELFGSTEAKHVHPKIVKRDGSQWIRVHIEYPKCGTATDPSHLLCQRRALVRKWHILRDAS